jgi:cytochrome c oxidase subunit 2|tara:strand:+ start:41239 stop:42411 length:1173 start_codon:yes stop_codon:yes gene_type:complete
MIASIPACLSSSADDGGFLNLTAKQSTFDPKGPLAEQQIDTFYITLWVTSFLFLAVGGTYLVAIIKFRVKKGDDPNEIPEQAHGHPLIEVGLVVASSALLIIIAIPTFSGIVLMHEIPEQYSEEDIVDVNVIGYQWWFNFEYVEDGFVSANELVIPAGRPVRLNLITKDVIHSFWLPKLSGKLDLMAGQINQMWILADEPGYFWGQCAEYCGDSHAYMLFRAVALEEDAYNEWVAQQQTKTVVEKSTTPLFLSEDDDAGLVALGAELFQGNCLTCHSLDPAQQGAMGAPNLAHFGSRSSIGAGWLENTWSEDGSNADLHLWIKDPDSVKPGNNMWRGFMKAGKHDPNDPKDVMMSGLNQADLSDSDVDALVAYLRNLKHPDAVQFSADTF